MKVYIVTEGSYSDYHIIGICSTEEKADRLCEIERMKSSWHDSPDVEEWELDGDVEAAEHPLTAVFKSEWSDYNNTDTPPDLDIIEYGSTAEFSPDSKTNTTLYESDTISLGASHYGWGRWFRLAVKADNLDKACKIAHDFWAEVQAEAAGVNASTSPITVYKRDYGKETV